MRVNGFGDRYCHTADEARELIDAHDAPVYVAGAICDPEGEIGATAEVADSHDGDLVCYIEAPTVEAVRAIIAELGIEVL